MNTRQELVSALSDGRRSVRTRAVASELDREATTSATSPMSTAASASAATPSTSAAAPSASADRSPSIAARSSFSRSSSSGRDEERAGDEATARERAALSFAERPHATRSSEPLAWSSFMQTLEPRLASTKLSPVDETHAGASSQLWENAEDASIPVSGGINGASAHLAVDLGHATALGLHLRVKDGVADVRIEGAGRDQDLFRRQEVATVLRQEGLSLGQWEVHAATSPDRAPVSHPRVTTPSAFDGPPVAQGIVQTPLNPTSAVFEGARRVSAERGATLVTPPPSGRRPSATEKTSHSDSQAHDDDRDPRERGEGLHVTA